MRRPWVLWEIYSSDGFNPWMNWITIPAVDKKPSQDRVVPDGCFLAIELDGLPCPSVEYLAKCSSSLRYISSIEGVHG